MARSKARAGEEFRDEEGFDQSLAFGSERFSEEVTDDDGR